MLHRTALHCSSHQFSELWSLRSAVPTASDTTTAVATIGGSRGTNPHLPLSTLTCFELLNRVRHDAETRSPTKTHSAYTIMFSPDGLVPQLQQPLTDDPIYCYTFNAPGTSARRLHVMNPGGNETWTLALHTGDLLEYRRATGSDATFRLSGTTDPAHCNGQRIIITVTTPP